MISLRVFWNCAPYPVKQEPVKGVILRLPFGYMPAGDAPPPVDLSDYTTHAELALALEPKADAAAPAPGTYTKLTVNSKGIITGGTTLSATDIPNLDWSKLTSGKPTTAGGYGITDVYTKTEIDTKLVSVYRFLGNVANYTALSAVSNPVAGDTYNALDTGKNWAWTGTVWDDLGGTVDLSSYYTKTQVDAAFAVIGHTHSFASLTAKPTTIGGYGITDAVLATEVSATAAASKIPRADGAGKLAYDITGNAASSSKWAAPITLTLTGSVSGTGSIDGSGNVTITTTGGSSAATMTPIMGQFFGTLISGNYIDNSINALNSSTGMPFTSGVSLTIPVCFKYDIPVSEIGFNVTTGNASTTMKLAIYSSHPTHGYPYQRIYQTSALDTSTTGYKSASVTGLTLLKNTVYWVKFYPTNNPAIRCFSSSNVLPIAGAYDSFSFFYPTNNRANAFSIAKDATAYFCYTNTQTGSSEETFSYAGLIYSNNVPQIIFKVA